MNDAFLDAHVFVDRPGHRLDVRVRAAAGEVVAVIGPNGSGKSTLLRAVAGLTGLSAGHVRCDGGVWEDPSSAVRVGAARRRVGLVAQQPLLFPHLSARDNVAFGPRSRGTRRAAAARLAQHWLDRLGVGDLAERRPATLSGGQAQRVALARALATQPEVLLLDEPFAGLDAEAAMRLRLDLPAHLAGFGGVTLLVTHDALDALMLANHVVVLEHGSVLQQGDPEEVTARPRTDHVARLVGLNLLRGESRGTQVSLAGGGRAVSTSPHDGAVFVCFGPAAVTLTTDEPAGSARNRWPATVRSVVPHGSAVRVHLDAEGSLGGPLLADVTPVSVSGLALAPGREVWASVKATEVTVYPAAPAPLRSRHV